MKKTTTTKKKTGSSKPRLRDDDDAKPLQSDKLIWVSVEGDKPMTFFKLIKLNSEPDVTPLSHEFAKIIRRLRVGQTYDGMHEAAVKRVAKPQKKSPTAKKAAPKTKTTRKKVASKPKAKRKGLSGAKSPRKTKATKPIPTLFPKSRKK